MKNVYTQITKKKNCTMFYMEQFFTTVPGIIISIGGILAVVIVGVMYTLGLWSGKKDNADDRLIGILKETVDALQVQVDNQKKEHDETVEALTKKIDTLTLKVDDLERENGTLIEVLQGRDKNTLEFQKQMLEAMKIGMETNGLAKQTSERLTELVTIMGDHLKAVGKQQSTDADKIKGV
jgi:antitoxin component HigA of HigAB toxin-antitoxin module